MRVFHTAWIDSRTFPIRRFQLCSYHYAASYTRFKWGRVLVVPWKSLVGRQQIRFKRAAVVTYRSCVNSLKG